MAQLNGGFRFMDDRGKYIYYLIIIKNGIVIVFIN